MSGKVKKFSCFGCGECCRDFSGSCNQGIAENDFVSPVSFMINKPNLPVFGFEADKITKKIKGMGLDTEVVPSTVAFDLKNKITLVLYYTLKSSPCPFLSGGKCIIYDDRLAACKLFPCVYDLMGLIIEGKFDFKKNMLCKFEKLDDSLASFISTNRPISKKDILKAFEDRYGKAFYYSIARSHYNFSVINLLSELDKKGAVKLARKGQTVKFLLKRTANFEVVNAHDYLSRIIGRNLIECFDISAVKKRIYNMLN